RATHGAECQKRDGCGAVAACLTAKTADGCRPRYLEDLRPRLNRFAREFGERKLSDISPAEIDSWLRSLSIAPLSRNTVQLRLSTFFEFARQRGWVTTNPLKDVPKAKIASKPPGILTVEQAAALLEHASESMLPFFAIGLFAGLRSAEIARLGWSNVRW